MKFKNLKVFKSKNIDSQEFYLSKNSNEITQISGYYFENTLHFYGYLTLNNFDDITHINDLLSKLYAKIKLPKFTSFGQDVFGNQFVIKDEIFYFLNIETGELEYITNGEFDQFVEILLGDINYFTGSTLIQKYSDIDKEMLSQGYRLSPIKPFVLGGEYVNQNLFLNKYIDNLELNSSIALQIYGLPDGQKVIIEKI